MAWRFRNPFASASKGPTLREAIQKFGLEADDLVYSSGTISRDKAATLSAMQRAVGLLSGSMADTISDSVIAVDIKTRKSVKGRRDVTRALDLLKETPDGITPAYQALEDAAVDLLVSGSAIFVIDRVGPRIYLTLANPMGAEGRLNDDGTSTFTLARDDDPDSLRLEVPGSQVIIGRWPRIGNRHLSRNSRGRWFGVPPIQSIKSALLLGLNSESWAGQIFDRNRPTLGSDFAIIYDQKLTKEATENVYAMLQAFSEGRAPIVLSNSAKVQNLKPTPMDADLLAMRHFQIGEVARTYGIPSILIGLEDSASVWGSSTLALELVFRRHSLRAWCHRLLTPLSQRLLPPGIKFVVDESRALRGDPEALKSIIDAGRPAAGRPGVFTRAEIRSLWGNEEDYPTPDDWNFDPTNGEAGGTDDGN